MFAKSAMIALTVLTLALSHQAIAKLAAPMVAAADGGGMNAAPTSRLGASR